jgi:carboxypeptidase PM20D1
VRGAARRCASRDADAGAAAKYSLLYTWEPASPSAQAPILLTSHLDVVPAADADLDKWDFEPFAGHIIDGFVYGRGAMDDKLGVLAIMEAVEALLHEGFAPQRRVYLAFGHDEEVGGLEGAQEIVRLLAARGERLDFVLDEGGFIFDGVVPGVQKPVAMVAVGEKGYVSVTLSVRGEGGHSSAPPVPDTPLGILSRAVARVEANPMPPQFAALMVMLQFLGAEMTAAHRLAATHPRLMAPVLAHTLGKTSTGNAQIRTVFAPTMMRGAEKDNVLPTLATAVINCRIAIGDSVRSVRDYIERVVADPRVNVTFNAEDASEPSRLSGVNNRQFAMLHRTIAELFPDFLVSPFVTVGMTDARWYYAVSDNVYRFTPYYALPEDLKRFHGINERARVKDVERSIRFYYQLIRNAHEPRFAADP